MDASSVHQARPFLQDLALVLCVAAVTTVVFRRLRQPVVLGYLLAGVIVGRHVPIPLFADGERVHLLSELGVVLVMFSVGIEFSIRKLVRVVPTAGVIGLVQMASMMWLGYLVAHAFGWTARECLFAGAMLAVSSTMVVAKVFAERGAPDARVTDTVFGVLIIQDLGAVFLLAFLTAISSSAAQPGQVLARTAGQLLAFLAVIVVVGFLVVPRTIRAVARLESPETLLVVSVGICFALALVAQKVGYSVALGAFIAGSLIAESGESEKVERLIRPLRDIFAAIFFVAVGMLFEPAILVTHWRAITVLTLVVIGGQVASVTLGALLSGRDVRTSVQSGMSLAQIGEFSFIIASVGVERKAIGAFLYPVAIAIAALTTFTTPWLVRASGPVASFVDRHIPEPLQTLVTLYGTWLEQLRRPANQPRRRLARLVGFLVLDTALIATVIVGAALGMGAATEWLSDAVALSPVWGRRIVIGVAIVFTTPFVLGVVRLTRSLGVALAATALPPTDKLDLALAPRQALTITLQLVVALLVMIPLLAVTQPFVTPLFGGAFVVAMLIALAVGFWRGATNLHEHVQAGVQVIVEALAKQSVSSKGPTLESIRSLLPGFGALTPVSIVAGSPAVGKTLRQLDLRALSGASVITILRGERGLEPTGREELHEGDVLALVGTRDAIDSAKALLVAR